MRFSMRRRMLGAVAGLAVALAAGCTTVSRRTEASREANTLKETGTLLGMVRQVGWNEVGYLRPLLEEQAAADFPGVAALAADLKAAAVDNPPDRVPPAAAFDRLIDRNPDFWRAYYEIAPGDPLMATLHVSLLLAAGDAVRADRVATLAINFGRMEMGYRKELVRLDTYAQLVIHVSGGDAAESERLRQLRAYATLAAKAEAALAVWPQNPRAWADLAWCEQNAAAPPAAGPDTAAGRRSLAALRRVDPLYDAALAGPAAPPGPATGALGEVRRLWKSIDDDKATGDDQVLRRFSETAQAAGLDELALVARGLLAGWYEGALPMDEDFIRTSLGRLLSPDAAAAIGRESLGENHEWLGLATDAGAADSGAADAGLAQLQVHPQLEQRLLVEIAATSYWIESGLSQGKDLAANFAERGAAWAQLQQKDEAVADLRRALALAPDDSEVRINLAVALSDGDDFAGADAVFAELRRRGVRDAIAEQAWANHLFKQARFAEAEAAYGRVARLDPRFAYAPIMRALARVRQGKPAGAVSDPRIDREDRWGGSLLAFLAGRIDEKALFDRLEPQGGLRYSEEECELYFVLAELALGRGDVAEARRDLHSCLGTGMTSFVEYAMARDELRRVDAAHPSPPPGKSRGADPGEDETT